MRHEFQKIRCQRCRAANPLGQELCDQCGTRLMLVVEPTAFRFEDDAAAETPHPSILLERMTILEGGLTRFAEKLERGFDLMLKQAQNIHREHLLVESLIVTLVQAGVISRADLEKLWLATLDREGASTRERDRREMLRARIVAEAPAVMKEVFTKLVNDGFKQVASGDAPGGLRTLERAAAHPGIGFTLEAFLGEQYYRADKMTLALSYLTRALDAEPPDPGVELLIAIVLAEEGKELLNTRDFLGDALKRGGETFAGRYALGRLSALEGDWEAARTEFKAALAARPCAESHFLFALASFQLSRPRLAARHAEKAIELDETFAPPYFLLGLLHRRAKEHARAREAFARAATLGGEAFAKGEEKKRAGRESVRVLLEAFFGASRQTGKRLLTAGDERLARLLREDALDFVAAAR
ncbi:MAG: tetratricopeptide repeat protein [Pyrinomonadaceae bacterium]